jgi:glycosyltransferase involved in cell wall biosynthesis
MITGAARARVAIVSAGLDTVGGHGVQAALLIDALRRDGYEVRFIPINPALPRRWRRVRRIPLLRTLVNQLLYLPSLAALARVDVVHAFSASYWSFLLAPVPAMIAGRIFGKRVILHYHSGEAADHLATWGWRVHPWLRLAHDLVVPSEYLRGVFARFGYRPLVIHNIVDLSRFRFRDRRPLRPRLVSTRNLEPYYRVDVTLQAFARVKAQYPQATLTVAGTGSEEPRLRALCASLQLDGVRFVGAVSQARMAKLLDAADLFVNASVVDNQPVSLLEAFAAGLPVITTPPGDIGAMLRHGENGWLVSTADPELLAEAILDALQHPDSARAAARRARAELARFTWSSVRQAWARQYAGVQQPRLRPAVRPTAGA